MSWLRQKRSNLQEGTLSAMKWAARRSGDSARLPAHLASGVDGEDAAFFYLGRKGYVVAARRWSSGLLRGDLDLVAWQGPLLCFIEVKTRTAHDQTAAEVAVDYHKRNVLRRLARHYMRQLPTRDNPPVRFDILSVYLVPGKEKEFVHFEGAFGWNERPDYEWR